MGMIDSTIELLEKDNLSLQVRAAIHIATSQLDIKFTQTSIDLALMLAKKLPEGAVRSWFLLTSIPNGFKEAKRRGEEEESLARSAGVHQTQVLFNGGFKIDGPENIAKAAFEEVKAENEEGLQRIATEQGVSYQTRLENPQRVKEWLNTISSNHDEKGQGFKEWGVVLDPNGEYVSRPGGDIFAVKVVPISKFKAQEVIEDVSKRNLVAEVVFITDINGNCKELRIFSHHVTANEEHSKRLLVKLLEKLNVKYEDIKPVVEGSAEILREVEKKSYTIFDVEAHDQLTPAEIKLQQIARKTFVNNVSLAAIELQAHLVMTGRKSGYVCARPDRRGSELQVAFEPLIKNLSERLKHLRQKFLSSILRQGDPTSRILKSFEIDDLINSIDTDAFGSFIESEFGRASNGQGTAPTLEVYVRELFQTAFGITAKEHNDIISRGPVQLSSVNSSNVDIPIGVFVTAISSGQSDGVAVSRYKNGTVVSLRKRTDKKMYDEAKEAVNQLHAFGKDALPDFIKAKVRNELKEYRIYMVLTSLALAYQNMARNGAMSDSKKNEIRAELCAYGDEALKDILKTS